MTYAETLDFMYSHLPMYQRIGAPAFKKNLDNTLAFCAHIGNPERSIPMLHVAGTNGKGSSSHTLAAILQAAGYKTGLYTSPHLKDFSERIRVNGVPIDPESVRTFIAKHRDFILALKPSFFEMTVAMSFDYFARQQVDIAVIEVGLGGRLDSTNVITPLLSLITNIGWDHMDMLGDTLPKIAAEKAGIIKPGVPVVISEEQPEVRDVFVQKATETASSIFFASRRYEAQPGEAAGAYDLLRDGKPWLTGVQPELKGIYQRQNLPGVLQTIELLPKAWPVPETAIRQGIEQVVQLTGLKGRWQKLADTPATYCDVGHNEDGIRTVLEQLATMRYRQLHIVLGMVKEKDIRKILRMLPKDAQYYFCQPAIPRGLDVSQLGAQAQEEGLRGGMHASVEAAIAAAQAAAAPDDLIYIGGSTFVVAEIPHL